MNRETERLHTIRIVHGWRCRVNRGRVPRKAFPLAHSIKASHKSPPRLLVQLFAAPPHDPAGAAPRLLSLALATLPDNSVAFAFLAVLLRGAIVLAVDDRVFECRLIPAFWAAHAFFAQTS